VVWAFEAAVPVTVMPYRTVLVSPIVVIVAEAITGGVTVAGLTVQVGVSVVDCGSAGVTWQLRSTVPLNPFTVPTVTCADDVPPGATAFSDSGPATSVKLCADAHEGRARRTPSRHKAEIPADLPLVTKLDSDKRDRKNRGFNKKGFKKKNLNKKDFANKISTNKDFASKDFNASDFRDSDGDDSDFDMSRFRFN
jgi:hypothetical protein